MVFIMYTMFKRRPRNSKIRDQFVEGSKASVSTGVTNLRIRLLNIFTGRHKSQPLMNSRMIIQRKPSKRMLSHPRLKVEIDSSHPSRKNTHSVRFLQLALEYVIAPVHLSSISLQGVVILLRMVVPKASGYKWRAKAQYTIAHLNQFT